jgi:flagellar motor switch/type III secretory pathway protein FliN
MNSARETVSVLEAPRASAAEAGGSVREADERAKQNPDDAQTGAQTDAQKGAVAENALLAASAALQVPDESGMVERQSVESRLPVQLDVEIPIRDFRVKNLLVLEPGALIQSQWVPGEDVPVASGEVQLAWSEFEVVDAQLAVRLTRLA